MTDKPEAVAVIGKDWSLLWASAEPLTDIVERTGISIGTPLYPAPITLHESQVRWRQAFDEMHQRAMKAEAALATPQPDASALVGALRQLTEAAVGMLADLDSRPMSGLKTIGRTEKLRARANAARAALSAWEQSNG